MMGTTDHTGVSCWISTMASTLDKNYITSTYENELPRVHSESTKSDHTYCYIADNPDAHNEKEKSAVEKGAVDKVRKRSIGGGIVLLLVLLAIILIVAIVLIVALPRKSRDEEGPRPSFTTPIPRYHEKECACTPSKLWLDVVVVIDNSLSMSTEELDEASTNLCKVFAQVTITQGEGHHSRVGVVTYGIKADAMHNLTEFYSFHQFCNRISKIRQKNETISNLKEGLEKAEQMFRDGRPDGFRKNVKEVIMIYASIDWWTNFDDAEPLADRMKISGKEIIVVGFFHNNYRAYDLIREIASDGFYNSFNNDCYYGIQHDLCAANCFCRRNWLQYTTGTKRFGSCLRIGAGDLSWKMAKQACLQISHESGHLATVFEKAKHDFIEWMYGNDNTTEWPYEYHIGLSYDINHSDYFWEQPVGSDPARIPLRGIDFRIWSWGYPSLRNDAYCVLTALLYTASDEYGWKNVHCENEYRRYICQMNSCDTDNYCPNIEE
ncbi:unnamed protein product [Cylicocyclus nassatus]|uniref:Uncharacterized protein n=1 Tax=Cylicocyclus nassatus TaxID=53992 RepID=A0AA36MBT4_CYLNA|nr:unnamed protein product [Cylicocyclus nassatus]